MRSKYFGERPLVDDIVFDPKIKCNDMSGYHITERELALVRGIVICIAENANLLREVALDRAVQRMGNASPIDDASLIPVGDGIASIGEHTTNPAEDLETIAKIAKLMRHIVAQSDVQRQALSKMSAAEYAQEKTRVVDGLRNRVSYFARNLDPNMYSVGTSSDRGASVPKDMIDRLRAAMDAVRGEEDGNGYPSDSGSAPDPGKYTGKSSPLGFGSPADKSEMDRFMKMLEDGFRDGNSH